MKGVGMDLEDDQFSTLLNSVGKSLSGKDVGLVITTLTLLLAEAGANSDVDFEMLLRYVTVSLTRAYTKHDGETIH